MHSGTLLANTAVHCWLTSWVGVGLGLSGGGQAAASRLPDSVKMRSFMRRCCREGDEDRPAHAREGRAQQLRGRGQHAW